jgi:NADPH:quinone reductase-like Zn-dependent oxidoreductase
VDKARLQAGQRVFINGCAGGVGAAAVQLARQLGAEVSGTCSATDMERMHTAGARQLWDYRKTDLAALRDRFDVVYDTAATMPTALGLSLLKPRGVLLDLNPDPVKFLRALVSRRYKVVICSANPANLGQVAAAAARGQLRLPVGKTASLREGIALISDIEAGRKIGGRGLIAMA